MFSAPRSPNRRALLSSRTALVSLCLAGSSLAQSPATASSPAAVSPAPSTGSFFERLASAYRADWHPAPSDPNAPSPPRRGLPSPLPSPPFPSADWSYGGSPTLGEADGNTYPLMTAIDGARSRTKLYGWVELSVNASTSAHSNYPETNDLYSNRIEMDQAVVYLERLPDSVQRDRVDIGYHLTAFYGTDYKSTTNKGYLSSQLIADHHQYGFDPVLEYIDIYVPHVAQGMNIRAGRFISIPGIEAQLTPNNYIFSHSLLYTVDPFTDTGILATIQLNPQWLVQAGITGSHDTALWEPDAQASGNLCVSHTTKSVNDNVYLCANGINDGRYAYDNIQQYDATWYHKISGNLLGQRWLGGNWHTATEAYLMYQRAVPANGGPIAPQPNTNGAFCSRGQTTCFAPEYAVQSYLNKQLGPHDFAGFRADFLNDKKGQRTGIDTKYSETTLMLSHWVGSTIQVRPELRLDHAWDRKAYDNATRQTQFTAAVDAIVHF